MTMKHEDGELQSNSRVLGMCSHPRYDGRFSVIMYSVREQLTPG